MLIRQFVPEFFDSAAASITSLARLNKTVTIVTGLLIPTIVGIYCTYYADLIKVNPLLFWFPVALMVGLGVLYSIYTWDVKLPAEALLAYLEATDRQRQLEEAVRYFLTLQSLISIWRSMADEYIKDKIDNRNDMRGAIQVIMKLVVDSRDTLFQFGASELWNFAVYLYNEDADLLYPVWRDRHAEHPSGQGLGRSWKPGVGHIGMAFSQGEARVTDDAQVAGIADLLRLPAAQARQYDARTYVSFVSQPIPATRTDRPWGVIVATSNIAGRFDEVKALALRHTAAEIGTILSLAYEGPMPI